MELQFQTPIDRRKHDPTLAERHKDGQNLPVPTSRGRSLGLGLITGASDDDPSAIGTYAAAGASLGPAFLWTAPVTFPMMYAVVYLCSKLGQVAGQGLFAVIRQNYSKWLLYFFLVTARSSEMSLRPGLTSEACCRSCSLRITDASWAGG